MNLTPLPTLPETQELAHVKACTAAWQERAARGAGAASPGGSPEPGEEVDGGSTVLLPPEVAELAEGTTAHATVTRLAATAQELQARLEQAEVAAAARTETAVRQTARYRAQWKALLQDRDRAHDQMLTLRERWLQGYDEMRRGDDGMTEVPLNDIAKRIHAHAALREEYTDALRLGRDHCRTLVAEIDDRQARLHHNLETADTERENRSSELADLRKSTLTVAAEQGRLMTELDVARRRVAGVETEVQQVTERLAAAKQRTARLRKARADGQAQLETLLTTMQAKEEEIAEHAEMLHEAEASMEQTVAMIQVAEAECDALGLKLGSVHDDLHGALGGAGSPLSPGGASYDAEEAVLRGRIADMQEQLDLMNAKYGEAQGNLAVVDVELESAAGRLAALLGQAGYVIPADVVAEGVPAILEALPTSLGAKESELQALLHDLQANVELHERAHAT